MQLDDSSFDRLPGIATQRDGFPLSGLRWWSHWLYICVAGFVGDWELVHLYDRGWICQQRSRRKVALVRHCSIAIRLHRLAWKIPTPIMRRKLEKLCGIVERQPLRCWMCVVLRRERVTWRQKRGIQRLVFHSERACISQFHRVLDNASWWRRVKVDLSSCSGMSANRRII